MNIVTGVLSSSGDNVVLAGAAGTTYQIYEYQVQLEGTSATTVLVQSDNQTLRRIYLSSQGSGFAVVYDTPLTIPKGKGITLNLSGANSVNYMVRYNT